MFFFPERWSLPLILANDPNLGMNCPTLLFLHGMMFRNKNVIQELAQVSKAAITCDDWTSEAQDHYLTVTVHYTSNGHIKQKVLNTKAVYESQTGLIVADEINSILEEFQINNKVVAATVDNASNMDVALKTWSF